MRGSHRGRVLAALLVLTLLVAPLTRGASGITFDSTAPVGPLDDLAAGERADPGWAALRLDLAPDRAWSISTDLVGAQPRSALGVFVYDAHDQPMGRVVAIAPEAGIVRYHVSSDSAPLRFETGGNTLGTSYDMGIRVSMSCGTCDATTLRVVLVASGGFDAFRWTAEGRGTTIGGSTEGAGAFAYRATDFRGVVVAEAQREEVALEAVVNGWRTVDVDGRLVGLFVELSGNPLANLQALAPDGQRACPCTFPDGSRSGGPGTYGFRATSAGQAEDLLLFGASIAWP